MMKHILSLGFIASVLSGCFAPSSVNAATKDYQPYNELTAEEERVILNKGTEPPHSGKFNKHDEDGVYTCKRCDATLFPSDAKFDSGTGWPSFDDAIPGAVAEKADGFRTEIVCANCDGHLGHVFRGEGLTKKSTRHCVNSVSLDFVPKENYETAIFAGGCFWGVEHFLAREEGVLETSVGYIGGHKENPTYQEVCSKTTGHAEAVEVKYDASKTSFEKLARLFFETHDPTQVNRQGPDIGSQYRSGVFYTNDEQKEITEKLIAELEAKGLKVATEVTKATTFWDAEGYHQDYYLMKGSTPYCHSYVKRF